MRREAQRRLPAELRDHAERLLGPTDRQHVLGRQRLEVQPARGVVVRRDRLGVGVDHHRLEPRLLQREGRVHAGVVELDALADPVRAGAEDDRPAAASPGRPRSRSRRWSSGTACSAGNSPAQVSTVLNTGWTPSASRCRRTAASVGARQRREPRVGQAQALGRAQLVGAPSACRGRPRSARPSSTTRAIWSTNHGSIAGARARRRRSCAPAARASATRVQSGLGRRRERRRARASRRAPPQPAVERATSRCRATPCRSPR